MAVARGLFAEHADDDLAVVPLDDELADVSVGRRVHKTIGCKAAIRCAC